MTKKPSPKTPVPPAFDPFGTMAEFQKAGLGPMNWMSAAWMEAMTEMGREMTEFVTERIQKDFATQQQVINCKDIEELREIQTNFVQCALEDYRAESEKLAEISNRFMEAAKSKTKA